MGRPRPVATRVSRGWATSLTSCRSLCRRALCYEALELGSGEPARTVTAGFGLDLGLPARLAGQAVRQPEVAGRLVGPTAPDDRHGLLSRTRRPPDHRVEDSHRHLVERVDDVGIGQVAAIPNGPGEFGRGRQPFIERRQGNAEAARQDFVRGTQQGELAGNLGELGPIGWWRRKN